MKTFQRGSRFFKIENDTSVLISEEEFNSLQETTDEELYTELCEEPSEGQEEKVSGSEEEESFPEEEEGPETY